MPAKAGIIVYIIVSIKLIEQCLGLSDYTIFHEYVLRVLCPSQTCTLPGFSARFYSFHVHTINFARVG